MHKKEPINGFIRHDMDFFLVSEDQSNEKSAAPADSDEAGDAVTPDLSSVHSEQSYFSGALDNETAASDSGILSDGEMNTPGTPALTAEPEPGESLFTELDKKASRSGKRRLSGAINHMKIKDKVIMTIFFLIGLFVSLFAILPIVLTILNSFMASSEIITNYSVVFDSLSGYSSGTKTFLVTQPKLNFIPDMVSFDQYATLLFKSPAYLLKFWNSVFLVVPIVIGQMTIGSLAAFSFARYRRKRMEVLFFSYIILMLMPFQVTLVPNFLIAKTLNIYDTWWAIILPGVFSTFSVFLLTKYMRQIPSSYIEAAKLDGAGEWHIFWSICIPMCKSALYAMSILLFIDYWNMVEQPLILLKNVDKHPLSVFLSQINEKEIGIAFAASFIFMIPPLLMFLYGEKYLIEGISRSGIK